MDPISVAIAVVVFFAMVVVGLDLTAQDFHAVARRPRLLLGATLAQILLLPLVGLALARGLNLRPGIALGLVLLAACPGGGISNWYTYLVRANTALSIVLTTVSNLTALLTLPLVLGLLQSVLPARLDLATPLTTVVGQLALLLTLPVLLGMGIRYLAPNFVQPHSGTFRRLSLVGVAALVVLVLSQGAHTFARDWAQGALASALLVALSMAAGYAVAAAYRLNPADRITLLLEFGARNAALPTAMAVMVLHQLDLAVTMTIYFLTQVPLILLGILLYKSVAAPRYSLAGSGVGSQ
jgi:BASS family bile acid:Na+ symporter